MVPLVHANRRQVRIAHRHLDRRVPQQLLHRLERHAPHHQMRCEGVPQGVPADPAQTGTLARAPEGPLALVLLQLPAPLGTEDQLGAQMPLRLEALERVVAERHLPVASALRRTDVTAPDRPAHHQPPRDEIDVVPAQRPQLADAQPGSNGEREHRPPLGVSRLEGPLALAEVQKSNSGAGPLIHFTLGTWESRSQSTATDSVFRKMVRWLLIDFGESPVASLRAL